MDCYRNEAIGIEPTTYFDSIPLARETRSEYGDFPFSWGEIDNLFRLAKKFPRSYFESVIDVRERARAFTERVIKPRAIEIEKEVSRDPNYFAWDIMKEACRERFFSMIIPKAFGGQGLGVLHMAVMAEELAVGCAGIASTIGVHSAGISCGLISLNPYLLARYILPVAVAEKRGEPILWAGAVTEPFAGTDIWDEDFLKLAKIITTAKRVPGGFRLTGRKVFISNGSVARWVVLAGATNPKDIAQSWSAFLVDTTSQGFSVGRVERKLGQKASPAAELILDDVFVPDERLIGVEGAAGRSISIYLAGSRGPVGAIGIGCARGALECLIDWAKRKRCIAGRMIDQQALQLTIARISSEIASARALYVQSCLACDEIFYDLIGGPIKRAIMAIMPSNLFLFPPVASILTSQRYQYLSNWLLNRTVANDRLAFISRLATAAKCIGSETGVRVCGEVARIMGPDAYDPRWPVEKAYRDAKLTMIYEGTNQANNITHFKDLVRTLRSM